MIVVVIVMLVHNDLMMMIVVTVMLDLNDLVMIVVVTVVMLDHDDLVMPIPIAVMVAVAYADGDAALLGNHHGLVACRGPGQGGDAKDCEGARDKSQLLHMDVPPVDELALRIRQRDVFWLRDG
jgi:hypothetical protein